jgi:hypothetical protein
MLPFEYPQVDGLVVLTAVNADGSVMVSWELAVHPLASVTTMLNIPGPRLEYVPLVCEALPFIEYERFPVPLFALTEMVPLFSPKQVTLVELLETIAGAASLLIVAFALRVQPFPSETITLYPPAGNELNVATA